MYFAVMVVALPVVIVDSTIAAAITKQSSACNILNIYFPYKAGNGALDFEMILYLDSCQVDHLWTPDFDCEFVYGASHGSTGVICQRELSLNWRVLPSADMHSYFETVGEGRKAVVPSFANLKNKYKHLNGDDAAKSIYADDFPRKFTFVGSIVRIDNPSFLASMQELHYETMKGEDRWGISADAVVGCIKYQFGYIYNPAHPGDHRFEDLERDVASFLKDLRLERVDDPIERLQELQPVFDRDHLLQPIKECIRR
jgi:hypothetical protein